MMQQNTSVGDVVVYVTEIAVYLCWGGVLDDGVHGVMTYVGGSNTCMWISPSIGIGDVLKMAEKEMEERLRG